jgi:aminodeoxyfutalosine deaminase
MNPRPSEPTSPSSEPVRTPLFVEAGAVLDADTVAASPGAVLIDQAWPHTLVAAGQPDAVAAHPLARDAPRVALPEAVVTPALVNAHAHLDLTHIGPQPYEREGGFVGWVNRLRALRGASDDAIRASVDDGIARSIAGGVGAVGDIAGVGSLVPTERLHASGLAGVSYVEFFGHGSRQARAIGAMREIASHAGDAAGRCVRIGLQPHAPYSCGSLVYEVAASLAQDAGVPVATHLAETPDERDFVASGGGAFRGLLESLGVWEDVIAEDVGRGRSPVEHLRVHLERAPFLLAHVNDVSEAEVRMLALTSCAVAYSPRCHAYFEREGDFGPHPFEHMLAAGVPVALGTDSVVNLPPEESGRLSVLDDARLVWQTRGTDARTLLAMMTTHGLRVLRMDPTLGRLIAGPTLGLIALRTPRRPADNASATAWLEAALTDGACEPRWVVGIGADAKAGA